jgi:hypothetical protein
MPGVLEAAAAVLMDVESLSERMRRWPTADWRQLRERVAALVGTLAELDQVAEGIPAATRREPARPAYDAGLADQVVVLARDLRLALHDEDVARRVLADVASRLAALGQRP